MMKKILAILGLSALVAVPAFAFAHGGDDDGTKDDHKAGEKTVFDKTAVSIGISNNGSILVRGAKVTDVGDSSLTAQTVVNGVTMTWAVDTDGDTNFVEADGDTMVIADISDGDYVSFSGMLTGSAAVDALVVRDWSVDEKEGNGHNVPDEIKKQGFWDRFKNWPGFSFWAHTKAEVR